MSSAFSAQTQDTGPVDLYPTEVTLAKEILATLNRRYSGQSNTRENLVRMAEEAENRFKEIGLNVIVDISNFELGERGEYSAPVVQVMGRIAPADTDHDRMKHEIVSGLADGKVGVVDTNTGELKEPSKPVSLWTPGQAL